MLNIEHQPLDSKLFQMVYRIHFYDYPRSGLCKYAGNYQYFYLHAEYYTKTNELIVDNSTFLCEDDYDKTLVYCLIEFQDKTILDKLIELSKYKELDTYLPGKVYYERDLSPIPAELPFDEPKFRSLHEFIWALKHNDYYTKTIGYIHV